MQIAMGYRGGINIWIRTHSSYPDYKLSDLPKGVGEGLISGFAPSSTLNANLLKIHVF
jgi:hypothetical protein